jgi:hypothetical protein
MKPLSPSSLGHATSPSLETPRRSITPMKKFYRSLAVSATAVLGLAVPMSAAHAAVRSDLPTLTIVALTAQVLPGAAILAVYPTYVGLQNGATQPQVPPTCGTTATSMSAPGDYPTTCSGASDPNYNIVYVSGDVQIRYQESWLSVTDGTATIGAPVLASSDQHGVDGSWNPTGCKKGIETPAVKNKISISGAGSTSSKQQCYAGTGSTSSVRSSVRRALPNVNDTETIQCASWSPGPPHPGQPYPTGDNCNTIGFSGGYYQCDTISGWPYTGGMNCVYLYGPWPIAPWWTQNVQVMKATFHAISSTIVTGSSLTGLSWAESGSTGQLAVQSVDLLNYPNANGFEYTTDYAEQPFPTLQYTGPTSAQASGGALTLSAGLQHADGATMVKSSVSFSVAGQKCTAKTDKNGTASCTVFVAPQLAGVQQLVTAKFNGDAHDAGQTAYAEVSFS